MIADLTAVDHDMIHHAKGRGVVHLWAHGRLLKATLIRWHPTRSRVEFRSGHRATIPTADIAGILTENHHD